VTVFFNLFAAAEPFVNVCVAHGALCSVPSFYPSCRNVASVVDHGTVKIRDFVPMDR